MDGATESVIMGTLEMIDTWSESLGFKTSLHNGDVAGHPDADATFDIYVYDKSSNELMSVISAVIYQFFPTKVTPMRIGIVDIKIPKKYTGHGVSWEMRIFAYKLLTDRLRCGYLAAKASSGKLDHILRRDFHWKYCGPELSPYDPAYAAINEAYPTLDINYIGNYTKMTPAVKALNDLYLDEVKYLNAF